MKMDKPQTYTPEFRKPSVKLALDSAQSIKQTTEDLGVKPCTLHTWIGKYTRMTREEAIQAIFEYIKVFYNRERIHSENDYLSPVDYPFQQIKA